MEQGAGSRRGGGRGEEGNMPRLPQPPQPPPQMIQSLEESVRPSPPTAVPSTSDVAGVADGLSRLEIGGGSGNQQLDKYLYAYMIKKGMHQTAEKFRQEAGVSNDDPVDIDEADGFLTLWWSIFYEVYASRQRKETK